MKALNNHPENYNNSNLGNPTLLQHLIKNTGRGKAKFNFTSADPGTVNYNNNESHANFYNLLTTHAQNQIFSGKIIDLGPVCYDLYDTFFKEETPFNALQFVQVLNKMKSINDLQIENFIANPETNHVLVQNELLKIVLIHWKPGKYSSIHGHPAGGCVFKVLHGKIEEKRYTPSDISPRLLASSTFQEGSIAYIDDHMAYHAVGNPFRESAISLHVYTPGLKN
jgi:hypothetical protein